VITQESKETIVVTQKVAMDGKGELCYYCGKPCCPQSANPSRWPIALSHPSEPGVVKWHHEGCVSERLIALESLVKRLEEVHADERYQSVWVFYVAHGFRYTEPTYTKEFETARALCK
jgi:hypothetical protein